MVDLALLNNIAIGLGLALAGGLAARLIGVSPIVGYLAAGVIISPFTPGYDADLETLREVAELGVIFLMFGVGLHFNIRDILRVRAIAVPGALIQVTMVTLVSLTLARPFGMPWQEAFVLGLGLGMASTVVLIRALEERRLFDSLHGRVAVGWLVVEDLLTVVFLAILPALEPNGNGHIGQDMAMAVGKAGLFLAVTLGLGAKLVPLFLNLIAKTGSREAFILAIVALAMAIATVAGQLGLSVAIGAFIAGVVVSETDASHQAASDVLPLKEAFAVLFFVSVGMLLDPHTVLDHFGLLLAICAIILLLKPVVAIGVAAALPYPAKTGLVVAAGLAQVGEFTYILVDQALEKQIFDTATYNVVLAASVITIALNPLAYRMIAPLERLMRGAPPLWRFADRQGPPPLPPETMRGHVVVAGYGRVGRLIGHALLQMEIPFVVVEADLGTCRRLSAAGIPVIWGDAASAEVMNAASIEHSRLVVVAVPDQTSAVLAVARARRHGLELPVLVRARNAADSEELLHLGASEVVVPEYEGGLEMMRQALVALGFDPSETLHLTKAVRDIHYASPA